MADRKLRLAEASPASRMRSAHDARLHAIEAAQQRMRGSYPRLQMTLIVALTGASGLLSSFLMLRGGLDTMALRYPLAVVVSYGMFLLLLWAWLRTTSREWIDVPDIALPTGGFGGPGGAIDVPAPFGGAGGDFGGGGASGSFDGVAEVDDAFSKPLSSAGDAAAKVADGLDLDEGGLPVIAVILIVSLAMVLAAAAFYVIYVAPVLLAEVVVDGALTYALHRRVRVDESRNWLVAACRRTLVPFVATAILVAIVGSAMSFYAPGARSVGEVVRYQPPAK